MTSKKDYVAVAAVLRTQYEVNPSGQSDQVNNTTVRLIARKLADLYASDNPRFNRARFLGACGVGVED